MTRTSKQRGATDTKNKNKETGTPPTNKKKDAIEPKKANSGRSSSNVCINDKSPGKN